MDDEEKLTATEFINWANSIFKLEKDKCLQFQPNNDQSLTSTLKNDTSQQSSSQINRFTYSTRQLTRMMNENYHLYSQFKYPNITNKMDSFLIIQK
ncbi:unnamed protein product [Paramecium primaurelia]|uniref:Uncharacterized protein n=1 Tax=Paramecium primaurelia TaxID=5886 RepID=A0A8S1KBW6_PARPR|nr:unnamed protein product [Paramecium primaurelia]